MFCCWESGLNDGLSARWGCGVYCVDVGKPDYVVDGAPDEAVGSIT